jgi:hypothetical protein
MIMIAAIKSFNSPAFVSSPHTVCGTSPVVVNGVENFDVTDLVSAHTDYCLVAGEILQRVRHLQPQRPSMPETEVAVVTTINVANYGITPLSDEAVHA